MAGVDAAVSAFEAAGSALKAAATISGTWGDEQINTGHVYARTMQTSLRRSAWLHVWQYLRLPEIASAKDKASFQRALSDPPPFDLNTLRATFGPYLQDPRGSVLRGLAEVFADLDPAYKSHEKVKIGVKGLPKRVIIATLNGYGGWGWDNVRDIINALAAYQRKPLVTGTDMAALRANGEALREAREVMDPYESVHVHRCRAERGEPAKTVMTVGRGVWLKRFQNGNGHLYFSPEALRDINRALAEFYGDVLADCPDDDEGRPAPRESTALAKDLQFYPTPYSVIDRITADLRLDGKRVLEPSCGDGRIMDCLKANGAEVYGVEVDQARAAATRAKGHRVLADNFLRVEPSMGWEDFDLVVMNPPFYGKHYAKHVRHAMRFLKPNGKLVAILPATARYDHGLLDDLAPRWCDLPVGAFSESGTNVCTTVATITKA